MTIATLPLCARCGRPIAEPLAPAPHLGRGEAARIAEPLDTTPEIVLALSATLDTDDETALVTALRTYRSDAERDPVLLLAGELQQEHRRDHGSAADGIPQRRWLGEAIPLAWAPEAPETRRDRATYARHQRDGFPPHWPAACESADAIAAREARLAGMLAAGDRLMRALAEGQRAADEDGD